jgi:hypothetical protein
VFLRELRGVWPAVRLQPDARATQGARQRHLITDNGSLAERQLLSWARACGVDARDLECALIRVTLRSR